MRAVCRKAEISCSIKEKVDTQQRKQDVHEGWLTMWENHCHRSTGQKVINDSLYLKGGTGEAKVTVSLVCHQPIAFSQVSCFLSEPQVPCL